MNNYDGYLKHPQASKYLNVHQNTLRSWRRLNKINAYLNVKSGHWMYKLEDLKDALESSIVKYCQPLSTIDKVD